ncbi:hypothetical protein Scep_003191 [Stephania cephalantha]|uniref:Uncharacterized protein n=1 Tax=Stephania cephalantha TaxID=152367 RepID=A0AAP0KS21_9MAGN
MVDQVHAWKTAPYSPYTNPSGFATHRVWSSKLSYKEIGYGHYVTPSNSAAP